MEESLLEFHARAIGGKIITIRQLHKVLYTVASKLFTKINLTYIL